MFILLQGKKAYRILKKITSGKNAFADKMALMKKAFLLMGENCKWIATQSRPGKIGSGDSSGWTGPGDKISP